MPDVDMLLESYGDEPASHYTGPSDEQELDHDLCMTEDALSKLNYLALWSEAHRLYLEHQISGGTRSLCEIMGSLIAKRTLLAYMERKFRWQLGTGHRLRNEFRAKINTALSTEMTEGAIKGSATDGEAL